MIVSEKRGFFWLVCFLFGIGLAYLATTFSLVWGAQMDTGVVINELAWMGTEASAYDEWIELYNSSPVEIVLDGWRLTAADGTPSISLSGSLAASGYFLLERTDQSTLSDIEADLTYAGVLSNAGETLVLYDYENREVDRVDCQQDWFSGDNVSKRSMERVDPARSGSQAGNWCTHDGAVAGGLDADGGPIWGTPSSSNSCHLLSPSPGISLEPAAVTTFPTIAPTADPTSQPTTSPSPFPTTTPTIIPASTPQPTLTPEPLSIGLKGPSRVEVGQVFQTEVKIGHALPNSEYRVKGLIDGSSADGHFYSGRTLGMDGISWLAWNASWLEMPSFNTDGSGSGQIKLSLKTKPDLVPGQGYLKFRLRDSRGDNWDSPLLQIKLTGLAQEPTSTPAAVKGLEDSALSAKLSLSFGLPTEVVPGAGFEIPVALCGGKADQVYRVKFLAGNGLKMYSARTWGEEEQSWLAWNASWEKFPGLLTSADGCGTAVLKVRIEVDDEETNLLTKVRLRDLAGGKSYDSAVRELTAGNQLIGGQVLGSMSRLPRTGVKLRYLCGENFVKALLRAGTAFWWID